MNDPATRVVISDVLPARHSYLEIAEFDNEIVVFDPNVHMVHLLTGVQALLLDVCDGHTATEAVVDEFVEAGVGQREQVLEALRLAFIDLVTLSLLVEHEPPDGPPCIGCFGAQLSPSRPHRTRVGRWRR